MTKKHLGIQLEKPLANFQFPRSQNLCARCAEVVSLFTMKKGVENRGILFLNSLVGYEVSKIDLTKKKITNAVLY